MLNLNLPRRVSNRKAVLAAFQQRLQDGRGFIAQRTAGWLKVKGPLFLEPIGRLGSKG